MNNKQINLSTSMSNNSISSFKTISVKQIKAGVSEAKDRRRD